MAMSILSKKPIKIFTGIIIFIVIMFLVILQSFPTVKKQKPITPVEMTTAKDNIKDIQEQLASYQTFVTFNFSAKDLNAISKLGTFVLPNTQLLISTSNLGVLISTSTSLNFFNQFYLNTSCWLTQGENGSTLDDCYLGDLPLPGFLIEWVISSGIYAIMGEEVSDTFTNLLASANYSNTSLSFNVKKSKYLRNEINKSLKQVGNIARTYTQASTISPELVKVYLDEIESIPSTNLAEYLKHLFALANIRSTKNDPVQENTAAIWSLAIKFGDYRFASLMGIKSFKEQIQVPSLRGRDDLAKHFIYSAILQQLADINIGLSIGESKELLDSTSGGTGLSFADIAANKAGIKFAKYVTTNETTALSAQTMLMNITTEDSFFPFIHDLPEGFTGNNFIRVIKDTDSANYKKVETEIDKRISQLALYRNKKSENTTVEAWPSTHNNQFTMPYKVDTHIHSKFSDGAFTVNDIAEQAFSFGCDAIAITDHGDHNLAKVTSKEYFHTIQTAQDKYPFMTIMPGLEWNIPPMNGREHATLILPKSENAQRNITAFRNRYDHFERFNEKVLSPVEALNWLDKHGQDNSNIKPLLLYNHPSRKDFQQNENEHDFTYWREHSDLVLGFSGAPGHQKKQGINNGSYEFNLRTVNGWDPSVENIGGEWDRLLQQGYKIWAARAASDFHNTKMDYWPCEYSSTHVMAKSRNHNDILRAFQSGNYWAQHGNFVNSLNFNIQTNIEKLLMGNSGYSQAQDKVSVNLTINLNNKDWQNQLTSLDEVELIIITDKIIKSVKFAELTKQNNTIDISYSFKVSSPHVVFRWRGKSTHPTRRPYMFYTNPIKIVVNKTNGQTC